MPWKYCAFTCILWIGTNVIKSTVNAAAECDPTERQGSSIREAVHRTLVTVCDKFQLVGCSQLVVSYSWEKVCIKVCHKSWITNNALTWNFVSNCKKVLKKHKMLKVVYGNAAVIMKTVYKWFEWFRNCCESVEDKGRSGRPSASKTQQNVERVRSWDQGSEFLVGITQFSSCKKSASIKIQHQGGDDCVFWPWWNCAS